MLRIRLFHSIFLSCPSPPPWRVHAEYPQSLFSTHPRGNSRSQDALLEGETLRETSPNRVLFPRRCDEGGRPQFFARCTCGFRAAPSPQPDRENLFDSRSAAAVRALRVTCSRTHSVPTKKVHPPAEGRPPSEQAVLHVGVRKVVNRLVLPLCSIFLRVSLDLFPLRIYKLNYFVIYYLNRPVIIINFLDIVLFFKYCIPCVFLQSFFQLCLRILHTCTTHVYFEFVRKRMRESERNVKILSYLE